MKRTSVIIGIQARSTSERLPGKCYEYIGEKRLLDHVIDACKNAANNLNRYSEKSGIFVKFALLIPFGDKIEQEFQHRCLIIQGPEHDVLTRYVSAAKMLEADYICRVTGDCPMIPPFLIGKHITLADINEYDYVSNCDESSRTSLDGIDCEVMSRKLLDYLDLNATLPQDREHVTTLARREPPPWAKMGHVCGFFDQSSIKLSVDTKEDLQRVRNEYNSLSKRLAEAERRYGKSSVHRV